MNPKQKMIAVLEVEFDPDLMIDEETLQTEYNGDWLKFMKWMFNEDSIGIFDKEIELVGVKQISYPAPTNPDKQ